MGLLQQFNRGVRVAFHVLTGWLILHGAALAAPPVKKDDAQSVGSGVYVMAYFLVIFGVAAGLLFVCRSSGRRERAKPEQYGETKSVNPEKKA